MTCVTLEAAIIVGYATVAACHIAGNSARDAGANAPNLPVPALRLARLAISAQHQKTGIGGLLLRHVIALAREMADTVGCVGLLVDAYPKAEAYYARFGFVGVDAEDGATPGTAPMFLALRSIP